MFNGLGIARVNVPFFDPLNLGEVQENVTHGPLQQGSERQSPPRGAGGEGGGTVEHPLSPVKVLGLLLPLKESSPLLAV